MYKGDRSRKETLVEYGFRLPSALDNRPLRSTSGRRSARRPSSSRPRRAYEESTPAGGGAGGASDRPGRPADRSAPGLTQVDDLLGDHKRVARTSACWSPR
jgi:excinuclease ABC subunit B